MYSRRRFVAAGLIGATGATLGACAEDPPVRRSAAQPEKRDLAVAVAGIPQSACAFLAHQRGLFKEAGLNVKLEVFTTGIKAVPKFLQGKTDIMLADYITIVNAQAKVRPMSFLSEVDTAPPRRTPIIVPRDSSIRKPTDLKGKSIAVNLRKNITELSAIVALRTQGLQESDVEFVEVPIPKTLKALTNGTVDAAFLYDPYLILAEQQGMRRVLETMEGPMASFPLTTFAATRDWVGKNPNTGAAFNRAINRSKRILDTDNKVFADVVSAYTGTPKEFAPVMGQWVNWVYSTNPVRLQRVVDLMAQVGYLKDSFKVKDMVFSGR